MGGFVEWFWLGHPARRIGMTNLEPDEFAYLRLGLTPARPLHLSSVVQKPENPYTHMLEINSYTLLTIFSHINTKGLPPITWGAPSTQF